MHGFWIITFVFGVIAAVIAYSKGRNSLGWFVAGMFVGPFALVVAFLPPVSREGMYTTCPACCEVIREEAGTCRYCGSLVAPAARSELTGQ
jgi:hypothetical protein